MEAEAIYHPRIGEWLQANPVDGVEAQDDADGLGPRLVGWDKSRHGEPPDVASVEAWCVSESAAKESAKSQLDADAAEVAKLDTPLARLVLHLLRK